MSGTTSGRFFWSDWRSDPGLRTCSLSARGLWMDMLCIAAEAQPTGYVTVNGRTLTTTDLARLTGAPEAEVQAALSELDAAGVFSRDRHGRIYSRRMIRDAKRSQINQKNGKNGGNPTLLKTRRKSRSDKPPDNGEDKPTIHYTQYTEEKITLTGDPKESRDGGGIVEAQVPAVIADIEPPTIRKRDSPKRQIPPDWWPSPDGILYAEERAGWFALELAGEVEHFRDHHRSNRNAFADHDAAWRNWVRNGIKFRRHETGRRNAHDAETAAFDAITRH